MAFDLNNILDGTLDDLAELQEFAVFPAGAYHVKLSATSKKIGTHPAIEITLTVIETKELADASLTPPAGGARGNVAFMLDNEIGQGRLKKLLKPIGEHFGSGKISDVLAAMEGAEALAVTSVRMDKTKTKSYLDIVELHML